MTDSEFKQAISEALCEEYVSSIPEHNSDHVFSEPFNKSMEKLIKRQRKPYYKIINTAGKRAACIAAAAFIVSFSTVMSVDALRDALKNFFIKDLSIYSEISYIDNEMSAPDTIESIYSITYDLSGYEIDYENYSSVKRTIIYKKEDICIVYYQWVKSEYNMSLNTEGAEISQIDIQGREAIYYCDRYNYHNLIWDNGEYVIMISSNIGKNELIEIANSVQKVE